MEIVHQLEDLFIQAIPTVIIIVLFFALMNSLFFKPIQRVMDERKARTEGARREAEASEAAAHEKIHAYEEALRKARMAVHAEQDTARRTILDERTAKAKDARTHAMERVAAEKDTITKEVAEANVQLETATPQLAAEIVRALIEGRPNKGSEPAGGAR